MHFRFAEIKESMRSSPHRAKLHRSIAFNNSNPSTTYKTNPHPDGWGFVLWRSRRDLNPRYPFGVHTISSRARYDHFDTAPWVRHSCRLAYDTTTDLICQVLILHFSKFFKPKEEGGTSGLSVEIRCCFAGAKHKVRLRQAIAGGPHPRLSWSECRDSGN